MVRVALHEIERLLARADHDKVQHDGWLQQMATELRTAMPELAPEAAAMIARRILDEPRLSLDAQSRLDVASLAALKS
ncbi:MAG: hypothetical protein ACXWU1_01135 [Allosphingosinicella sp.]